MKENLSVIIKKIEDSTAIATDGEVLYIDHASKVVMREKPSGGVFSKPKYSAYSINKIRSVEFVTDMLSFYLGPSIEIENIEIRFMSQISCYDEELLVKGLHSNFKIPLGNALEKLLYIWSTDFFESSVLGASVDNYKNKITNLLPNIIQEKGKLIGLVFSKVDIMFKGDDTIEKIVDPISEGIDTPDVLTSLELTDVPIYLKGFEEAIYFNFKITLKQIIDSELGGFSKEVLVKLVERKVQEYLSGKPFEYIKDDEDEWKLGLKDILEPVFSAKGRQLEEIIVKYTEPDFIKSLTTIINHDTELSLKSIGKKIIIGNELLLTLEDAERFIAQKEKIGNLEHWIKENLDEVIRINLFGKTIKEMALPSQFENARNSISVQITNKIKRIGYNLKYIISEPQLSIKRSLTEGVRIETTKKFETIASKAFANFEIIIEGKVHNLEDVSEYLNLEYDDFKKKILKTTIEEFKSIIHKTHPESIFSIDTESKGIEDVKDDLIDHVGGVLEKKYGLKDLEITIKFLDTELSDRFKKLANKSPRINMKLLINNSDIPFKVRYEIIGINNSGWSTFQRRSTEFTVNNEMEEINRFMYEELIGKFKDLRDIEGDDYLMNRQHRNELKKEVLAFARERVIKKFGLEIDLMIDNHNTPMDDFGKKVRLNQQAVIDKEQEKYDKIRIQKYFDMRTIYLDKQYELQNEILNATNNAKKKKLKKELELLRQEIMVYEHSYNNGFIKTEAGQLSSADEEE